MSNRSILIKIFCLIHSSLLLLGCRPAEVQHLRGHTGPVVCTAFSEDGEYLASGSGDKTVRLWKVANGIEQACLIGHSNTVTDVFYMDDNHLLTSSLDGTIRLWNIVKKREVTRFAGHTGGITDLDLSPDKRFMISGGLDGTVRLWSIADSTEIRSYMANEEIDCVSFSPDGSLVAAGSIDNAVRFWDSATENEIADTLYLPGSPRGLIFLPNTTIIMVSYLSIPLPGQPGCVLLWDYIRNEEVTRFDVTMGWARTLALSIDSQRLFCADVFGKVFLWDIRTERTITRFSVKPSPIYSVCISPSGDLGAVTDNANTVRLFDLTK